MALRILLLTQWFEPEPTFKGLAFARELIRQGYEVEVLTGFPNYPGGKLYPGYRIKWMQREIIEGVRVTRVPLFPSHDQSVIGRVLNYVSFCVSSLVYGLFFARRIDVIYAYHPPLTVGVTAGMLRLIRRIPVVYDVQDMWPDTLRATGMINRPSMLNLIGAVCSWVYRRVDHIVVLSPGFKSLLIDRGVPESKISVIYNWANESSLAAQQGRLPEGFPSAERFRVVFAGNMGKAQALDTVLDAAALLQARMARVDFVLVGGGVDVARLKKRADDLELSNVFFFAPIPMSEIGRIFEAADILLVHLRKDPLFKITIPSKTQAYMAVGKPVLMAVEGDAQDLVVRSGGGVVAEPENSEELANTLESLANLPAQKLNEMGCMAGEYYRKYLALGVGVANFGAVFDRVRHKD